MIKKTLFTLGMCAAVACLSSAARASLTVVSVLNGVPTSGANYVNFDTGYVVLDGVVSGVSQYTVTNYNNAGTIGLNITPNANLVTGTASGQYAAPFIGLGNGAAMTTLFGNPATDTGNPDSTQYVTAGSTGATAGAQAELVFGSLGSGGQHYLGLLWGSVDSNPVDYNVLTFYFDDGTSDSITGVDVSTVAGGNQGDTGTYYVNIDSSKSFYKVVATSSNYAFEFDNVAYGGDRIIPEATTIVVWSVLGLIGVGVYRRRK